MKYSRCFRKGSSANFIYLQTQQVIIFMQLPFLHLTLKNKLLNFIGVVKLLFAIVI